MSPGGLLSAETGACEAACGDRPDGFDGLVPAAGDEVLVAGTAELDAAGAAEPQAARRAASPAAAPPRNGRRLLAT